MSEPLPVDILSDSDGEAGSGDFIAHCGLEDAVDLVTPPYPQTKKKQRIEAHSTDSIVIIDDETEPCGGTAHGVVISSSTPSFVPETPLSDVSLVKCSRGTAATEKLVVADTPMSEFPESKISAPRCNPSVQFAEPLSGEISCLICVDSDNEVEKADGDVERQSGHYSKSFEPSPVPSTSSQFQMKLPNEKFESFRPSTKNLEDEISVVNVDGNNDTSKNESSDQVLFGQYTTGHCDNVKRSSRMPKEEKLRLMQEKKENKEREKLLKAVAKAQANEMKKSMREMQKWEKGKYALKSIVAEIDKKVVELGSTAGYLLSRIAEKGLSYRITSNPIKGTIVWSMVIPEELSSISSKNVEITYVLVIYDAEEFCNLVSSESLEDHVRIVRNQYPHRTICYLTNRLMAYINKREQAYYKNPTNHTNWKRPAIDEVLAKLATHYFRVHSRHCVDEAELAEHVVDLTYSLATCQFRKKLTRLSVSSNGCVIPKDCVDKDLFKKNLWLKALIAIPKVQPRFALAIWKKYPTMKSLLSVYMNPAISVHEKEFLLMDLKTEGLYGDNRRVGEVCSKRIHRILMAQCGNIKTDDVENGADFFT